MNSTDFSGILVDFVLLVDTHSKHMCYNPRMMIASGYLWISLSSFAIDRHSVWVLTVNQFAVNNLHVN